MIGAQSVAMGMWPGAINSSGVAVVSGIDAPSANTIALADSVFLSNPGGGSFCKLAPGAVAGDSMTLVNLTAAVINVVPSYKINNATTVLSVASLHAVTLRCMAKDNWYVMADVTLTGGAPSDDEPAA